jgi:hypothetical protein
VTSPAQALTPSGDAGGTHHRPVRHRHRRGPRERPVPGESLEQSLGVSGTVTAGGPARPVRGQAVTSPEAPAWRVAFTLGDSGRAAQLCFVGAQRASAGWLLRRVRRPAPRVSKVRSSTTTQRTTSSAALRTEDGAPLDVELGPVSPSISFDLAHTCEAERWLYWRILVEARPGWPEPCGAGSGRVGTLHLRAPASRAG